MEGALSGLMIVIKEFFGSLHYTGEGLWCLWWRFFLHPARALLLSFGLRDRGGAGSEAALSGDA